MNTMEALNNKIIYEQLEHTSNNINKIKQNKIKQKIYKEVKQYLNVSMWQLQQFSTEIFENDNGNTLQFARENIPHKRSCYVDPRCLWHVGYFSKLLKQNVLAAQQNMEIYAQQFNRSNVFTYNVKIIYWIQFYMLEYHRENQLNTKKWEKRQMYLVCISDIHCLGGQFAQCIN